jgi:hypothetical protein
MRAWFQRHRDRIETVGIVASVVAITIAIATGLYSCHRRSKVGNNVKQTVLILRTCNADMMSARGFQWPESGPVEAMDWDPRPVDGGGLHGLYWGIGDIFFTQRRDAGAKWLVFRANEEDVVHLVGCCKVKRGVVEFAGQREPALTYLLEHGGADYRNEAALELETAAV